MTAKIKVYGMMFQRGPKQVRTIVAARSQKAAVEALNAAGLPVSLHLFRTYSAETGNKTELATATEEGVVYYAPDRHGSEYRRWEEA
jgi:hypothetical protein